MPDRIRIIPLEVEEKSNTDNRVRLTQMTKAAG